MRLTPRQVLLFFLIGAAGGIVGDAAHVETGTTTYLAHGFPFVWRSALWFPVAVGVATVATAELRMRLGPATWSAGERWREGSAAVAAVLAIYAITALVHDRPEGAATTLVGALAVLAAARFASGLPALVCGATAAVLGPLAEIVIVKAGAAEYAPTCDGLFGVALWLPALYFAFGVVVSRLAELVTTADGG